MDRWGDYDLLFGAAKLNLRIMDQPVHYQERIYGVTKMTKVFKNGLIMLRNMSPRFSQTQAVQYSLIVAESRQLELKKRLGIENGIGLQLCSDFMRRYDSECVVCGAPVFIPFGQRPMALTCFSV